MDLIDQPVRIAEQIILGSALSDPVGEAGLRDRDREIILRFTYGALATSCEESHGQE